MNRRYMSSEEFKKLVTFWQLRGTVSEGMDMGTKGIGKNKHQVKRIQIDSKNATAVVTYTVLVPEFDEESMIQIDYCDIVSKTTGLSSFYIQDTGLKELEKI